MEIKRFGTDKMKKILPLFDWAFCSILPALSVYTAISVFREWGHEGEKGRSHQVSKSGRRHPIVPIQKT